MRLVLCDNEKITKLDLPPNVEGSFFLKTPNGNEDYNLVSINSENGKWIMTANADTVISYNNQTCNKIEVVKYCLYYLKSYDKQYIIYVEDTYDNTTAVYKVLDNNFIVGQQNTDIIYNYPYIGNQQFKISYTNNNFNLTIVKDAFIFKNGFHLKDETTILHNGDIIFFYGLKMMVCNKLLVINNPAGRLKVNNKLQLLTLPYRTYEDKADDQNERINLYSDKDYFYKTPRIRRYVKTYDMAVATPPAKMEEEDTPLILVIGPMATMGVISISSFINVLSRILNGKTTIQDSWPMLLMSISMLISMLVWPTLTKRYQKKKAERREKKRIQKYRAYVASKQKELAEVVAEQTSILKEKLITVSSCSDIIEKRSIMLWNRQNIQEDFLSVRIGTGDTPLDININFSENEFSMDEDFLLDEVKETVHSASMLRNVPIEYSFRDNKVTAIMGMQNKLYPFMRNVIFQLLTFHSYDELKLVFLVDENNVNQWKPFKDLPHCFSNDQTARYFASTIDEMKIVSSYLEREFIKRATDENGSEAIQMEKGTINYKPYYLIITDCYTKVRKLNISNLIMETNANVGFGFIIIENKIGKLPRQCLDFINLGESVSETLKNNAEEYIVSEFKDEINDLVDYQKYCEILANIPIELTVDGGQIPNSLSFLEMFKIGKIEQLNALTRWKKNDPTKSLRALVGVNDSLDSIYLDLHEKYHGPHGLIAGTTGSGKSEFIITYILSMAINYSPEEVSFILIDYKGGGLAGAFENKTLGIRLPHLSGVITNLDKSELNRTLVSINSELKKRQTMFNEARDKLGESTMDIYKYQKFYREGRIDKPISHLFIICDEFAELKSQQPDFMNDLISAARIGRSLGVHLILATQKPSGVVNDQIWSNTKFRVCLKVQDRSDSNEMLKRPEAADIKNAGRFYLQVGNDEIFVLGQSGYAGITYKPSDFVLSENDDSVVFIDNVGQVIKEVQSTSNKSTGDSNAGDQLLNVLKYVTKMANKNSLIADRLWLDSIPKDIYVDTLVNKYDFNFKNSICAVIGEYDDPANQRQGILTLPFNDDSNTVVFGRNAADREMFLNSIIYSLCTHYISDNINLYILDFGSETLRMFSSFPQVGDVMFAADTEKVSKAFSVINDLIVERKSLFADYNGDYFNYCKNSGKTVPLILFMINNYESFIENYQNFEENIVRYSREGKRYGIIIMITASSAHGFPNRVRRNFNNIFALELTDKADYMDLFGRIGNLYPADVSGRGICKVGMPCEFQTAQIYDGDDIVMYLKKMAAQIEQFCKSKAPAIPVLPEQVTIQTVIGSLKGLGNVPVGIAKANLLPAIYNFKRNKATIISATELETTISFINTLIRMYKKISNLKTVLIDLNKILDESIDYVNGYCDKNLENNIPSIIAFIDKNIAKNKENNLLLILAGVSKLSGGHVQGSLGKLISLIASLDNANIVIVDSAYEIKKLSTLPWYSSIVKNDDGIWIGDGLSEQTTLKLTASNRAYGQKIGTSFAWYLKNGQGALIKIVEMSEDEKQSVN